jgi:hypothetical protein
MPDLSRDHFIQDHMDRRGYRIRLCQSGWELESKSIQEINRYTEGLEKQMCNAQQNILFIVITI